MLVVCAQPWTDFPDPSVSVAQSREEWVGRGKQDGLWHLATCHVNARAGRPLERAAKLSSNASLLPSNRPRRCSCPRLSVSQACRRAYTHRMANNANASIFLHASGQPLRIFVEPTELTFRPRLIRDLRVACDLISLWYLTLTARLPAGSCCRNCSLSYRGPGHHRRPGE